MASQNNKVRIALVGCGAISQSHAKAIAGSGVARCTALFDLDPSRAELLQKSHCPEAHVARSLEEVIERADAAIVAVPNSDHAGISKKLLRAGLHVLCEKPLAISLKDAQEMTAIAAEKSRILACGLVRRFYGSTALVSEALNRQLLGRPVRFEVRESVWNWPLSRATFDRAVSGGGVLIDMGPHVFDLVERWLGPIEIVEHQDDNKGGVEAISFTKLVCHTEHGKVPGQIFLTRAYKAINLTRIYCTEGYIEVDPHQTDRAILVFGPQNAPYVTTAQAAANYPFLDQLEHFIAAINSRDSAALNPETSIRTVRTVSLIESCYQMRKELPEPWSAPSKSNRLRPPLPEYKKILVTGTTGAVGSRLVEMWAELGGLGQLRCMVRSHRTAARVMRFPLEVIEADLLDKESVRRAAQGCDAILHLGVGEKAARETECIVDVALELKIRRFVHISTAAVYGRALPKQVEELQENTRLVKTGEPYADEKTRAEQIVMNACRQGLEAVILRPHMVYGPGLRWSAELMELLAKGKVPIIEDGGWCNLIFVDDLVESIRLALQSPKATGEPMFVTDGTPIKWSEYIAAHAALIDAEPPLVTRAQVEKGERNLRQWVGDSLRPLLPVLRSREFRAFIFESPAVQATVFQGYLALRNSRAFKPYLEKLRSNSSAIGPSNAVDFDEMWTALQLSDARLYSAKAESLIGFRANVSFSEGLRRTVSWFGLYGLTPGTASLTEAADAIATSSAAS